MSKMDERILVIERTALFDGIYADELAFHGTENNFDMVERFLDRLNSSYTVARRGDVEENPTYKQPIPYLVVAVGDKIFTYKRLSGGGESRLHSKISIGVGGHMNVSDPNYNFDQLLCDNAFRELNEELEIDYDGHLDMEIVSFINDDSDEVGKAHVGILLLAKFPEGTSIKVRETDQLEGSLLSIDDLTSPTKYNQLENWSRFALTDILDRV